MGIYPKEVYPLSTQRDICTPMFVAALFTIAKTWKQPKCPSTDEWIKKMWFIYTMEYDSAIQKSEIMPLNRFLSAQYSIVKCRCDVVQPISRTYSSCITETLYLLNNNSPFPPHLSLWQLPFNSLLL